MAELTVEDLMTDQDAHVTMAKAKALYRCLQSIRSTEPAARYPRRGRHSPRPSGFAHQIPAGIARYWRSDLPEAAHLRVKGY